MTLHHPPEATKSYQKLTAERLAEEHAEALQQLVSRDFNALLEEDLATLSLDRVPKGDPSDLPEVRDLLVRDQIQGILEAV